MNIDGQYEEYLLGEALKQAEFGGTHNIRAEAWAYLEHFEPVECKELKVRLSIDKYFETKGIKYAN